MKLSRLHGLAGAILAVSVASAVFAQTEMTLKQKVGYSVGVNIGNSIAKEGIKDDLDGPSLAQGIQDVLAGGSKLKMTPDDIAKTLEQLSSTVTARAKAEGAKAEKASKDFLAKNAKEAGVKTTASGLQYQVITKGKDPKAAKPKATDTVKVHYEGKLVDGTVFDSSIKRGEPIVFPLNQVIPGWTEGVQLMSVGDKFKFAIPPELGYGPQPTGPIPANSALIFEVELLSIEAPAAADGAAKK